MNPVFGIALWGTLFIATHLILSSLPVRQRLVAVLGEQPFRGVYSVVAIATLALLIVTFAQHKHAGPMLWYLRSIGAVRGLTFILMLAALIVFAGAFVTPNPGGIGAPSEARVRGMLKITRHPSFVAFILFGLAHLLMNGWVGDLFFFGTFVVLGVAGGLHQDERKLRELGETYGRLVAETSFVPGVAIIEGRQRLTSGDIPWAAMGIGLALTIVLVLLHPY
ncbi:MAG: NnrU family protein, partial [Gammaproteobacteria bacterium]